MNNVFILYVLFRLLNLKISSQIYILPGASYRYLKDTRLHNQFHINIITGKILWGKGKAYRCFLTWLKA